MYPISCDIYGIKFNEAHFTSGIRGRSRTAAKTKMEPFVIIVNGWKPLTIITKRCILDVAAALYPPMGTIIVVIVIKLNKFQKSCK